jgi:D-inositol-3-phosphate glycosyltransferase
MLSFVWSDPLPLYSGRGGTESYTVGHIRELMRRGIDTRILSYGLGKQDGRDNFPDITFKSIKSLHELSKLDDTIIYLNIPHAIDTKKQSYVFFHYPAIEEHGTRADYCRGIGKSIVLTNSRFLRAYWADFLDIEETEIEVIYPFADPAFSRVKRSPKPAGITRVLYAGRLSPEKGIYTLLESLHHPVAGLKSPEERGLRFTVARAGNETIHGKLLDQMLQSHPWITLVKARHTPEEMARLFAEHDIVVMPSNNKYWHDAFGMISVEAQHSGCRVVASNGGGLPETNCGELILFEPGNSFALYRSIHKAAKLGPLTAPARREAMKHFSLAESVDLFLNVINGVPSPAV